MTGRSLRRLGWLCTAGLAMALPAQVTPPVSTGSQGGWPSQPGVTPPDPHRLDPRWSPPLSPSDPYAPAVTPGAAPFGATNLADLLGRGAGAGPGPGGALPPGFEALGRLFGAYPTEGGASGLPTGVLAMPALPPEEPDWPRNLARREVAALPYVPTLALLLRLADRVWWRAPDEDAFVPLYFHDNVRGVPAGTAVEVRQTGEFELLLHGGGRLRAKGPTSLQVLALDEQRVELRLCALTHVQFAVDSRRQTLRLPDGSAVEVAAADPKADPPPGPVTLRLDRIGDPLACEGRLQLANHGLRAVTWRHAFGSVELQPGQRVQLFATPPAHDFPAGLVLRDATAVPVGAGLECTARGDGEVLWSGARFRLAPGTTLRLEPLLGSPFAIGAAAQRAPN